MSGPVISRRSALELLAAAPLAAHAALQMPPARSRRIVGEGQTIFLLEADGTAKVWCFGAAGLGTSGYYAGVGSDERLPVNTAIVIPGLQHVADLAVGGYNGYALLADGRVMAWGGNARGGLGNTPRSQVEVSASGGPTSNRPTPVIDIVDAIGIAAGDYHAHAVTKSGEVYSWGYNLYSQLGIGDPPIINFKTHTPAAMAYLPFPVRIPGLAGVTQVAAGSQHSLALLSDGTIRAWGTNKSGQLGDGTTITRISPVPVLGVKNAVAVAARAGLSAALLADGTVMMWGFGNSGLGRKTFTIDGAHPTPAVVAGATGVRRLSISSMHVLAITGAGTVISWGDQNVGEVGHDGGPTPAPIPGLTDVQSVSAKTGSSFAVLNDGRILTWGGVPYWGRVVGGARDVSRAPIPLVVKNLNNPFPSVVNGRD